MARRILSNSRSSLMPLAVDFQEGGTDPDGDTPEDVAKAQRQLKVLQWVIPALTGAVLVLNARMGEQQRPAQVTGGLLGRLRPGRAA
jgi:hypothetical protein